MNPNSWLELMGHRISTDTPEVIAKVCLSSASIKSINTINPHSYIEQKYDFEFRDALCAGDYLIPDGSGIVLAARFLYGERLNKVAGFDIFGAIMRQLNSKGGRAFFLGSSEFVLEKIKVRASLEFPKVQVSTLSPPFKDKFSDSDIRGFHDQVIKFGADVVFVGLTAPKQEKLVRRMVGLGGSGITYASIGAVFDFYAETVRRPSRFWIKLHLEWLVRLLGEPKRLWRRNFVSTPKFIFDLLKEKHMRR